jgi:ABC-2 type transport system ATP-binding protein
MLFRPNPALGVPIYLQLMEQVKHAVETGALRPGEQLPGIRPLAEELVINPNTVAKAYRELEHEGVIELRHGAGAFVSANARTEQGLRHAAPPRRFVAAAIEKLHGRGVTDEEIRRLFEAELAGLDQDRRRLVADAVRRGNRRSAKELRADRSRARPEPAGPRRSRFTASSARTAPARRRRSRMLLGNGAADERQRPRAGSGRRTPAVQRRDRRRTGFAGEDKDLYDYMTVEEMVRFTAGFFPRWRRDLQERYLRTFDLPSSRRVKALSRGMRTKLALLLALSRGAELLVLDEPTSGLDPAMTEEVLQALVAHVASAETTVFFSSHQIAEVDQIADHVAIIDRGRTVVAGALDDLRERYRRVQLVFDGQAPEVTFRSPGVERVQRSGRVLSMVTSAGTDRVLAEARALNPVSVDVLPVTLKEIFLESVATERAMES